MRTRTVGPGLRPALSTLLLVLPCSFAACRGERAQPPTGDASAASGGTVAAQQSMTEKWVSPNATAVLYKPAGWQVEEGEPGLGPQLAVRDPGRTVEAAMAWGPSPGGSDVVAVARTFLEPVGNAFPDLTITRALQTPDGSRAVVEGTYTDPAAGRKAFRLWVDAREGQYTMTRITAPESKLEQERSRLLSILANVRVIKGTTPAAEATATLVTHRLQDGSASFLMPRDWQVQEFGAGTFAAADPAGSASFIVASVDVLNPGLGVQPPGAVVAPYQPPHQALAALATAARLASNIQFVWVNPRPDVNAVFAQGNAPVTTEEFIYTFTDAKGRPAKAYSFGISFGSQTGAVWKLWHITVGAPADKFDALGPTFIRMLQSYRLDETYARAYVQRGLQNLRRLQQETARITARNAEEIHAMMQAAYDERQRSQDYIDYQRTNYIRGQQDWISDMEGGAVHHTDSWGTRNTVAGECWEGAPYDYVNFTGRNPKYDEQMTPIDSRRLWERHAR